MPPLQGTGVQFPGQGLRSCKLHGMAKKQKKRTTIAAPFIITPNWKWTECPARVEGATCGVLTQSVSQFSSVAHSCPTLCGPTDCSTPGLPVHHQLLEFTQTHVHWVGDAIQPTRPLFRPLLLLPWIFPSIRVFSNESTLRMRWPQYWSFSFSISPSSEYSGLISLRMDWLNLLAVQGTLKTLLQHHGSDTQLLGCVSVRSKNTRDTETRADLSSKTGMRAVRPGPVRVERAQCVRNRLRGQRPAVRGQAGGQSVLAGAWCNGRGPERPLGVSAVLRLYLELTCCLWFSSFSVCLARFREVYQESLVHELAEARMKMFTAVFSTAEEKWAQPKAHW